MKRGYEDEKLIEGAIKFLVNTVERSGTNPKPVILHSMRVAMYLEGLEYSRDIVVGALLHDLLEDTDITTEEIEKKFGNKVAKLVEVNSFRKDINDKIAQYQDLFERCKKAGRDALVIKAADILDNRNYYGSGDQLFEKMRYFVDFSKEYLSKEIVWNELNKQSKT